MPQAVFTGDTLFNAGVGNPHNGGSPDALYETIAEQFHTLPDGVLVTLDTITWPITSRLCYRLNPLMRWQILACSCRGRPWKTPVVTSIGDERTFNAFFRLDNGEIQASLELMGAGDREVFLALRAQRNHW